MFEGLRVRKLLLSVGILPIALAGCGEKLLNDELPGTGRSDATIGGGGEGGDGGAGGAGGTGGTTPDTGVGGEGGAGGSEPMIDDLLPYPDGCANDAACGAGKVCRLGVCVPPPRTEDEGSVACELRPNVPEIIDAPPAVGCWEEPRFLANGPATVTARGKVEYFGDGKKTVGLQVRIYDFETFDPTPCLTAGDGINNVLDRRTATEACIDEHNPETLAATTTVDCQPILGQSFADSGCYELQGVPTGRALVVRITGERNDWVPTYHYGHFINPCVSAPPRRDAGTCPEQVTQDVEGGDWECSLIDDRGVHFYRDFSVISQQTWISFPPTAGVARIREGLGAVAGRIYDCYGRSVANARVGFARTGDLTTYFNGNPLDTLPQPGRTQTNLRGTYAELNAPAGPNGLVAVVQIDDDVVPIGYQRFVQLPDSVVMINPAGRAPRQFQPPY